MEGKFLLHPSQVYLLPIPVNKATSAVYTLALPKPGLLTASYTSKQATSAINTLTSPKPDLLTAYTSKQSNISNLYT
jgi:hypothetical protein